MNALVIGCGSIGKRHVRNLARIPRIKKVFIYTKIRNCLDTLTCEKNKIHLTEDILCNGNRIDFAMICNETSKHVSTAISLAENGINLFIEKPISHNTTGLAALNRIVRKNNIKVFIAYNLRFLGALKYLKRILERNSLGKLYFAKIEAGQYLPFWRPDQDYRKSYSAIKTKGGGVSLDLSHEIDYMRYLFGDPLTWHVMKSKVSDLKIDTEDMFEGLYKFTDGFTCTVHLDYLQKIKKREIRITGSKGTAMCDLSNGSLSVLTDRMTAHIDDRSLFDIDKTYTDELQHFITSIVLSKNPLVTLSDGIQVLQLLDNSHV